MPLEIFHQYQQHLGQVRLFLRLRKFMTVQENLLFREQTLHLMCYSNCISEMSILQTKVRSSVQCSQKSLLCCLQMIENLIRLSEN